MKLKDYFIQLSKEKKLSKRLPIYKLISDDNVLQNGTYSETVFVQHLSSLYTSLLRDAIDSNEESMLLLLNILKSIHSSIDADTVAKCTVTIDDHVAIEFLRKLLKIMDVSNSDILSLKILHIMELQCFEKKVMTDFVELFLSSISASKIKSEGTIVDVINKFICQCPEVMQLPDNVSVWLKLLLSLTSHDDISIRKNAIAAVKQNLPTILSSKQKIIASCATFLKEDLILGRKFCQVLPNLNSLIGKEDVLNEILSLHLPIFLEIIGEDYKRSSRLSNSLLKFVEKGFCHSDENIKLSAFRVWERLIECFANNKDLLASSKYFNLFTQPLRIKLKTETITKALLETMWKLAQHLDDHLPNLFELLCAPLFGTCFKGTTGLVQQRRRSSGRASLSKQQQSLYKSVQIYGAEMISHLLVSPSTQNHKFGLGPLREPYLGSSSAFARFYPILIPAIKDMICQLHVHLPVEFLLNIWNHTLKCVEDTVSRKKDIDIFRSLYQAAFAIVSSEIDSDFLLTIVSSLKSFPNKILNSSLHYHSESAEISMHGTPIVSILRLLFSANVRRGNMENPKFLECAQDVIACGMERRIGNLEFIRSVVSHLFTCDTIFLKIWKFLAEKSVSYLEKTGNVNDGDSLEHDFSFLYQTLLFPFRFIFDPNSKLAESFAPTAEKTWAKLFQIFAKCARYVITTKRNEVREHIATQFLNELHSCEFELSPAKLSFLGVILFEILNGADFSNEHDTSKSHRKKNSKKPAETSLLTGFNLTAEKLLIAMEVFFNESSNSFPPFNVLPSIDVIISSVPQPLVAPFFFRVTSFLFEYIIDMTRFNEVQIRSLEHTWSEILLRLNFTVTLFEDDLVCQLFAVAFSDSRLCKFTYDFWNLKVPKDFDVSNLPEILRKVLVAREKEPDLTWNEPMVEKTMKLDVSTVSEVCAGSSEEEALSDSVANESDVSMTSLLSTDASFEQSDDDEIKEISQVENENITYIVSQHEDLDVINYVTQEGDKVSNGVIHGSDVDISDVTEDDEITQLERAYISSDDEREVSNRSLNLRSLASVSKSKTAAVTDQSANSSYRRSSRLAAAKQNDGKTSSAITAIKNTTPEKFDDDKTILSETSNETVNDSKTCVVISDSEEESLVGVKAIPIHKTKEIAQSPLSDLSEYSKSSLENQIESKSSVRVGDESPIPDDTFYSCKDSDAATESFYDVVEMAHASVNANMDDLTIDSSLDHHQNISQELHAAPVNNPTLNQDSGLADCITDNNTSAIDRDEGHVNVEMAEMSIMPDQSLFEEPSNAVRERTTVESVGDTEEYEYVQMAETSTFHESNLEKRPNITETCLSTESILLTHDSSNENLNHEGNNSEHVKMSEISVPPYPHQERVEKLTDSSVENVDEEKDDSEYVEMAEMSIHPDPHQENFDKPSDTLEGSQGRGSKDFNCVEIAVASSDPHQEKTINPSKEILADENHQKSSGYMAIDEDTEEYEVVEMAEMSIYSDPRQERNRNFENGSTNSVLSRYSSDDKEGKTDKSTKSPMTSSDRSRSLCVLVEMNDFSVASNKSALEAPPNTENKQNDFSGPTLPGQHVEKDLQNTPDETGSTDTNELSVEDDEIIANSQSGDWQTDISDQSRLTQSHSGVMKNLKVLSDVSFNAFVRDLGMEPLNNSFETTGGNETNKETVSKDLCLDSHDDVIEDSEPLRNSSELLLRKSCEKQVVIELEKISTPKKVKHSAKHRKRPHIRQCKKKSAHKTTTNDTTVSILDPGEIPDHYVADDVPNSVELNGALEKGNNNLRDNLPSTDDTANCNSDVTVAMETTNSPLQNQNISTLKSSSESPQASERKDDDIETPKSCLGKRLSCVRENTDPSPVGSPCGILKKRVSDVLSPATKTRRVSFAEPISTSTLCPPSDNNYRSPLSSPRHFKKPRSPSRLVSRRLSLPVPHRSYDNSSPMSQRSVLIAAAIADIKSRNGDAGSNPSVATSSKGPDFDVTSITLSQLTDGTFLKTLTAQQLHSILEIQLNSNPLIYSLLISKLNDS